MSKQSAEKNQAIRALNEALDEKIYGKKGAEKFTEYVVLPEEPDITPWPADLFEEIPAGDNIMAMDTVGKHRVSVIADTMLITPELYLHVFVAGSAWEQRAFAKIFARAFCWKAPSIDEADLVIFPGGADVDPALYGEKPHMSVHTEEGLDEAEMEVYEHCKKNGIPMLGICRGAQFLHVMNGGKLYQDVDNHYGPHSIYDRIERRQISNASSVHHQMVASNIKNGMQIIASASATSKKRWLNDTDYEEGPATDIEAFWYRDTCCLGIQGHPEYEGYPEFTNWSMRKVNEFIVQNPDLEWRDKTLRVKSDILEEASTPAIEATVPKTKRVKKETPVCAA